MSTPTIEDRCAFGSWCPKKSHARLWCVEKATGASTHHNGKVLRMCATHGPVMDRWGHPGATRWIPDDQRVFTTGELAL